MPKIHRKGPGRYRGVSEKVVFFLLSVMGMVLVAMVIWIIVILLTW